MGLNYFCFLNSDQVHHSEQEILSQTDYNTIGFLKYTQHLQHNEGAVQQHSTYKIPNIQENAT